MKDRIKIDENSLIPKYKQLVDSLISHIASADVELNDRIPSVKKLSTELGLSRETVFKALNILSEKGIITSSNRRGYFVTKKDIQLSYRVFFMLDKMTPFKEEIYDGLRNSLGKDAEIDIYFHHGNKKVFESLIEQNLGSYSHYVISTFFDESVSAILNVIPDGKLIIIDQYEPGIKIAHSQIYQDFEKDIYTLLTQVRHQVKQYERVFLVAPASAPHRKSVSLGFNLFCSENSINASILEQKEPFQIIANSLYILIGIKNNDLVKIIKHCREHDYELGNQVGVISYNETQLKEILEGGITVISTDFTKMGVRVAELIQSNELANERNPSKIIIRKSL